MDLDGTLVSPSLDALLLILSVGSTGSDDGLVESSPEVCVFVSTATFAAPSVSDSYPDAILSVVAVDDSVARGDTAEEVALVVFVLLVVLSFVDLESRLGLVDDPLDGGLGEMERSLFLVFLADGSFLVSLLLLLLLVRVLLGDA